MSNSPESYPEQKFKKHTIIRNKHEHDEKMVVMGFDNGKYILRTHEPISNDSDDSSLESGSKKKKIDGKYYVVATSDASKIHNEYHEYGQPKAGGKRKTKQRRKRIRKSKKSRKSRK